MNEWQGKAERLLARHKMILFPSGFPEWKWLLSQDVVDSLLAEVSALPPQGPMLMLFGYPVEVVAGERRLGVVARFPG